MTMYILHRVMKHSALFYAIAQAGRVIYSNEVDTAGVRVTQDTLEFLFNKEFYKKLTETEKDFIVAHECLHIVLKHHLKTIQNHRMNVAEDIVINELLLTNFGFKLANMPTLRKMLCTIQSTFKDTGIRVEQSADYYYNRLPKQTVYIALDDHTVLRIGDDENGDDELQAKLDSIFESLTDEQQEELLAANGLLPGIEAGNLTFKPIVKIVKKPKLAKLFRHLSKTDKAGEHWLTSRRTVLLDKSLSLPTYFEQEKPEKKEVWIFLDTSGSCISYAQRFYDLRNAIPKHVRVHSFGFSTRVYPIKSSLKDFGGTSFHIIENYIQKQCKDSKKPYPVNVCIVTDGYGDKVAPQYPERWIFLLTDWSTINYIPERSKHYRLADFE